MNKKTRINRTAGSDRNKTWRGRAVAISLSLFATTGSVKHKHWRRSAVAITVPLIASVGVLIYSAFADAPVLSIRPLGTNQFNIVITNAITTNNYTLFWTPALQDQNYPWQIIGIGNVGETNFAVDGGGWPVGFFRVLLGSDSDGDGVSEWQDAQPQNPSVGILSITIDSPTNGMVLQ